MTVIQIEYVKPNKFYGIVRLSNYYYYYFFFFFLVKSTFVQFCARKENCGRFEEKKCLNKSYSIKHIVRKLSDSIKIWRYPRIHNHGFVCLIWSFIAQSRLLRSCASQSGLLLWAVKQHFVHKHLPGIDKCPSWISTPGNLEKGSRWLCTQNLYASFRPWLTRHPNVNKRVSSPDLLIFRQFHRHILKNRTVLFPVTFISTSEKTGVGLEKQAANFYFNFTWRRVVRYSCFYFFFNAKWMFFFSYLDYELLN